MQTLKTFINTITTFSEQSWAALLGCATVMEVPKKGYLLKEGEVCKAVYFVSSGLCRAVHNRDGREINTAFYFENDFATNLKSLTTGAVSDHAIQACERSKVIRLDKTQLLEAYKQSHQIETFGRKVLELITARQQEHADSFKLFTPRQRFENLVATHPEFLQKVSLTQAASYLGISRETLSRLRAAR